jgi:hypothetical protein
MGAESIIKMILPRTRSDFSIPDPCSIFAAKLDFELCETVETA